MINDNEAFLGSMCDPLLRSVLKICIKNNLNSVPSDRYIKGA